MTLQLEEDNWQRVLHEGSQRLFPRDEDLTYKVEKKLSLSKLIFKYFSQVGESRSAMIWWLSQFLPEGQKDYLLYLFETCELQLRLDAVTHLEHMDKTVGECQKRIQL